MKNTERIRMIRKADLATCYLERSDPVRTEATESAMRIALGRDHKAAQGIHRAYDMAVKRKMYSIAGGLREVFEKLLDNPEMVRQLLGDQDKSNSIALRCSETRSADRHFSVQAAKDAPGGIITETFDESDFAAALDRLADLEKNATVQAVEITDPEGSVVETWIRSKEGMVDMGSFDRFIEREFEKERMD